MPVGPARFDWSLLDVASPSPIPHEKCPVACEPHELGRVILVADPDGVLMINGNPVLRRRPGDVGVGTPHLIAQQLSLGAVNRSPRLNQIAIRVEFHDRCAGKQHSPIPSSPYRSERFRGRPWALRDPDVILCIERHRADAASHPVVRERLGPGGVILELRNPVFASVQRKRCTVDRVIWSRSRLSTPNPERHNEHAKTKTVSVGSF